MRDKDQLLLEEAYMLVLENKDTLGMDTTWEDGNIKVTITDVIKYLDEQKIPVKQVNTSNLKNILINQDYKNKQKDRVSNADLNYPIIVSVKDGKYKSILDGNHRTYKAIQQGITKLPVRELNLNVAPKEFKALFD